MIKEILKIFPDAVFELSVLSSTIKSYKFKLVNEETITMNHVNQLKDLGFIDINIRTASYQWEWDCLELEVFKK